MGAIITFVAVAFSTVRAGSHSDTASEQSALVKKASLNATGHDDDEEAHHSGGDDKNDEDIEVARQRMLEKSDRELLKLDEPLHSGEHSHEPVKYNYSCVKSSFSFLVRISMRVPASVCASLLLLLSRR